MVFNYILNNAEPFALNLEQKPWRVAVRAQVIQGFVALGLGKGGLFVSSFLWAMAWSEEGWLIYAVPVTIATLAVMIAGYVITLGRIVAEIDLDAGAVRLTKRIPFHRRVFEAPLSAYQGVALISGTDRELRTTHTLELKHAGDPALNLPLWQRRHPDTPLKERRAYAEAFGVVELTEA